jgi:hypothetical protein
MGAEPLSIFLTPYSLGKLIDWKLNSSTGLYESNWTPYSLGKLIDWKQWIYFALLCIGFKRDTPYSLGKLIDWKPGKKAAEWKEKYIKLPTR